MQSKGRSWADIRLIISSISIGLTLGFWGLLTSQEKRLAVVSGEASLVGDPDAAAQAVETLVPGQVLYLSSAAPPTAAATTIQTKRNRRKGDGGGGDAVASTGSS